MKRSPPHPGTTKQRPSTTSTTCEYIVNFRTRRSPAITQPGPAFPPRVPRVARLMALAIRFESLVCDEKTLAKGGYAKLAVLGHVTRARISQIMNLRYLAPDIQEAVLHLPEVPCTARANRSRPMRGRSHERITERDVRPIAAVTCWHRQRRMWRALCKRTNIPVNSPSSGT